MNGARLAASLMLLCATLASSVLERSMPWHMLVQFPLLFCSGMLFSRGIGRDAGADVADHYDAYGIPGLLLASGVVASWMVPRALDAAVEQSGWDALKVISLVAAGALAERSWRRAPAVVRAFVAGNAVWMNATIGLLLIDAPDRLCASYTANEQTITGYTLVVITGILGTAAAAAGLRGLADRPEGGASSARDRCHSFADRCRRHPPV